MGVNSLPKTVTRQRRDYDLSPGPSAPESSTLTTRLLVYCSLLMVSRRGVVTLCLHVTVGCATGCKTGCRTGCVNTTRCTTIWMNYANEPSQAALERSSQDAYDVIACSHAARRMCRQ